MKNKIQFYKISAGIFIGIILNVVPMYLVQYVLKWPLFMDTLGSISVAFIFGGIPAIICATLSQIVMFFIERYLSVIVILYGFSVWAAIGVICIFRKYIQSSETTLQTVFYLLIISIATIFAVSVTGGIVNGIDKYIQRLSNNSGQENAATSYFQTDLLKMGISSVPAYILSRIPGNLIERPIVTLLSFGLCVLHQKCNKKA